MEKLPRRHQECLGAYSLTTVYMQSPKDSNLYTIFSNGSLTTHFQAVSTSYPSHTSANNMPTMQSRIFDNSHYAIWA